MPRAPRTATAAPARRRRRSPALVARAREINARLAKRYPEVTTVVNQVTPDLFRRYPTVADFAAVPRAELEQALHRTGFFRNKAKSVQEAAQYLLEHHDGKVPDRMEDLVKLPGVGRKTANVVLGSFFSRNDGVVVDTHVTRLSRRLGLTRQTDPEKIEQDLMGLLPPQEWTN